MVTSLIELGSIETSVAKAKDLKKVAERIVTIAKTDSVAARRRASSYVRTPSAVAKLFKEIGPKYASRKGGYLRMVRTRVRPGDSSELALVSFVDNQPAAA
jgi:large subunit ribosomal protein L17